MAAGFYNGKIMFAENVRFDGDTQPGQVTADGQLLIGSSVAPNIRVATLASSDGSVTITNGPGTIDLQASTGTITDVTATNAGSSVTFTGTTVKNLEVSDASNNTLIGLQSGNPPVSGISNTAVGYVSLNAITTGNYNSAFGAESLLSLTEGNFNSAFGRASLQSLTTGDYNTAHGYASGSSIVTGNQNTLIGDSTGISYTGAETGNILLGNDVRGVIGESYVTRIGNAGNGGVTPQSACYIDGIVGVTTSNSQMVTIDSTTGQLGVATVPVNQFVTVTGTLTSTQIKALRASPVVIVPAQGAGTMIRLISFSTKFNYGGTNVFTGSNSVTIYPESNTTNALATILTSAVYTSTSSQYFLGSPTALSGAITIFENLGIQISVSTATEISGNAANDNTISYSVTYQVVSI